MGRMWRWTLLWAALGVGAPVYAQAGPESDPEVGDPGSEPEVGGPGSESGSGSESEVGSRESESEVGSRESEPEVGSRESEPEVGSRESESGLGSEAASEVGSPSPESPVPPPSGEALPPPPSEGYVAPPGYAPPRRWEESPPGRAAPHRPEVPRMRRVQLRYQEGMPVPRGASLVTRRPRGLLVPGLIGFAVTYVMNIVGSTLDTDNAIIAVPLVGLPIHQARDGDSYWAPMVAVHTVVQAAALALLVAGLIPRRYVEYVTLAERSKGDSRRWALVPTATRRGAGLALTVF